MNAWGIAETVAIIMVVTSTIWIIRQIWLANRAAKNDSEIIGRDDATGRLVTRVEIQSLEKKFSGNSHDRRVRRRAYVRQEKTPLS